MQRLRVAPVVAVALAALMTTVLLMAPMAYAQEPTYSLQATPDKAAYHIGAIPQLSMVFSYQDSSAMNVTFKVAETNHILEQHVEISGTGSYTQTYTLSLDQDGDGVNDYTNSTGTKTYTLKAIDEDSLITLASCEFTINVQKESVQINVAWEDADGDRLPEPAEPITLHIQVVWAFLSEDKSVSLYVSDVPATTFTMTAETGQYTYDYMISFDTTGPKTIIIKVVDSDGNIVASRTVTLVIEEQRAEASGIMAFIEQNTLTLALLAVIVILLLVIILRKR